MACWKYHPFLYGKLVTRLTHQSNKRPGYPGVSFSIPWRRHSREQGNMGDNTVPYAYILGVSLLMLGSFSSSFTFQVYRGSSSDIGLCASVGICSTLIELVDIFMLTLNRE